MTSELIAKLLSIVRRHIGAAIYLTVGVPIPGMAAEKAAKPAAGGIEDAYLIGLLEATAPEALAGDPAAILKTARGLGLSPDEQAAVEWLKLNAGIFCQGLGNRIEETTLKLIHDGAREAEMLRIMREVLPEGVAGRKTRSEIIADLREATKDMSRDWHRIVNTELHTARTRGKAAGYFREFGADAHVFMRPNPDACDLCKQAYLDSKGTPRIFLLRDIITLSNVGRKTAELRANPGLPPVHPHCQCQMNRIDPARQGFDADGRLVFL